MATVLFTGAALLATAPAAHAAAPATVGLVDTTTARWHLMDEAGNTASFYYGDPGDSPMVGDWDCDGFDSPGLYRRSDGYVYLRNRSSQGNADLSFFFGDPGDVPLAGDFNGDGCDTVSVYRPSEARFYIINELGSGDAGLGRADVDYVFGDRGDVPIVGDFDGDGVDTVGLYRPTSGRVYYRNRHRAGNADADFIYGNPSDRFVTGDWTGDGTDTVGIFRPNRRTFYLRYRNTAGNADATVLMGRRHMVPVAGRFQLGNRAVPLDWRSFTLSATGDFLIHRRVYEQAGRNMPVGAYDFRPMLARVKPIIEEADLALCHLEVPLSRDNTGLSTYPRFNAPYQLADAIADAGYAGCSTASNHSLDQGEAGVYSTLDVLDAAGVGHTGMARSPTEAAEVTTYEVLDGVTVAHLSYTYWFNGLREPPGKGWLANEIDVPKMLADAAIANDVADVVVVSIHWGNQYQRWPNSQQFSVGRALTASPDVDLIIGHHAHVVQPIGVEDGKHIVYGVGNFLSGQVGAERQDGVIVTLEMVPDGDAWRVEEVRFEPTHVVLGSYEVLPAGQMLHDGTAGSRAGTLRASLNRTRDALRAMGTPHILQRVPN